MKTKTKKIKRVKPSNKKQQKKKIIVASLAVGAAGILGYFGWQYLKKKRENKKGAELDLLKLTGSSNDITSSIYTASKPGSKKKATSSTSTRLTNNEFPLKKGSQGETVRLLQQALITKYGKSILPKSGADGDFGTETLNALKKKGLPTLIDESTFNVLTQGLKPDNASLGKELYAATSQKNFSKAIILLKKLQTTEDYSIANEQFKTGRINGVRQTIVNGLLSTFSSEAQKQAIKFEFLRIGLQFDGSKWSLSGFDGRSVITTEVTTVWINATEGVKVPARMVLGNEVSKRLDYTLFENNGKYFLVNTKSVQYLN